jgi:hypothetical protein
MTSSIADKIVIVHRALDAAGLKHAFGGALALAWCTQQARGTIDIDVNIFTGQSEARQIAEALPNAVAYDEDDVRRLERDGQIRLFWDHTPLDVFLVTHPFHLAVAGRSREEQFHGERIPFLACDDLAVFKAFFNRTRDWADIEEMVEAGTLDVARVVGIVAQYLGGEDERVIRLLSVARDAREQTPPLP